MFDVQVFVRLYLFDLLLFSCLLLKCVHVSCSTVSLFDLYLSISIFVSCSLICFSTSLTRQIGPMQIHLCSLVLLLMK